MSKEKRKFIKTNKEFEEEQLDRKEYSLVRCPLNFGDTCMNVLDNYCRGNDEIDLEVKINFNGVSILYNDDVIASTVGSLKFKEEVEKINMPLEITDDEIHVWISNDIIKEDDVYSEYTLRNMAKNIGYDEEKLNYLLDNNVPGKTISLLLSRQVKGIVVEKPSDLYIDENNILTGALISVLNDTSLRLVGEKSTGKNTFIETLLWLVGRPSLRFAGARDVQRSDLIGDTALVGLRDENGQTYQETAFVEGVLPRAMREGIVLISDEIDLCNPGVLGLYHGPLDNSRMLLLPNGEVIKAKEGFCVIATMNESYAGSFAMNRALLDRMDGIEFKALSSMANVIKKLKPDTPETILVFIDKAYKCMRKLVEQGELDSPYSVRGFLSFVQQMKYGQTKSKALEMSIINKLPSKTERETLASAFKVAGLY